MDNPRICTPCLQALLLSQLSTGGTAAAAAASSSWEPSWALPPAPKAAFLAATGALAGCTTGLLGIGTHSPVGRKST